MVNPKLWFRVKKSSSSVRKDENLLEKLIKFIEDMVDGDYFEETENSPFIEICKVNNFSCSVRSFSDIFIYFCL